MDTRTVFSALGAGSTTFLAVAVLVVELLDFEFSAVIGLPIGLIIGGSVVALLLSRYGTLSRASRVVVDAAAGFGYGILLVLGATYVNLATLAFEGTVATAVVVGVLAGAASWLTDRSTSTE